MSVHIPCCDCNALNRLPEERLSDSPKCGKCAAALLPPAPRELSVSNFARLIGKCDLPVVVDFWAPWCGPCKMMAPSFAAAATEFVGKSILAKLDTEAQPTIGSQYNIRSIPTLVVFQGGRERARQSGALSAVQLHQFIERHLA